MPLDVRFGDVTTIHIDRPAAANAFTGVMWKELIDLCRGIEARPEVRVVVVSAEGKHFSSGADTREFADAYADLASTRRYNGLYRDAVRAVAGLKMPVIAAVQGLAIGGGTALATAADLRFCGAGAGFRVTASKLGIAFSPDDSARLIALIGRARTKDMLFSARTIAAEEAFCWGLADRIVPQEALSRTVMAYAEDLAGKPAHSLACCKRIVDGLAAAAAEQAEPLWQAYASAFRAGCLTAETRRQAEFHSSESSENIDL